MSLLAAKPEVIIKNGKPRAVVLNIKEYERLLDAAEEKMDGALLRHIKKGKTSFRSINEYLKSRV